MTDRQAKAVAMSSYTMRISQRLARSFIVQRAIDYGWKVIECHRTSRSSKIVVVIMEETSTNCENIRGKIHSFRL